MELDTDLSNIDDTDNDEDDNKTQQLLNSKLTKDDAISILSDAINKESMRNIWRSDIAYLNESMSKDIEIFKNIQNIISKLIGTITDDIYDCWAVK